MVKVAPVIIFFYQYTIFFHFKSSSISQFIKDKSRDPQNLLQSSNGMTTSVFKGGIGGCGRGFSPSTEPCQAGLALFFLFFLSLFSLFELLQSLFVLIV